MLQDALLLPFEAVEQGPEEYLLQDLGSLEQVEEVQQQEAESHHERRKAGGGN